MKKTAASPGGFALVLVLGLVALVIAILVAFLLNVSTERSASNGFAASVSARQLGDTAVNIVEAQINHATTRTPSVAWTSQPGLLRTFNADGKLIDLYKLYSAGKMITSQPADLDPDTPLPGSNWTKNPALWVDLNERASAGIDPATKTENFLYPIFDPRAADKLDGMDGLTTGSGSNRVENGLRLDPTAPAVKAAKVLADGIEPAPMPVRWLYVLKDGQVVLPTGDPLKNVVSIPGTGADAASGKETNPVIGRVAFWTDDETSKVNVNTASEGSFWDTPRGYTNEEVYGFALKQPARGEYQRYPGHPATVSLSAVFPGMPREYAYSITPRVVGEYDNPNYDPGKVKIWTSMSGTVIPKVVDNPADPKQGVHSDGDRLFASLDELMFLGKRDPANAYQRISVKTLATQLTAKGVVSEGAASVIPLTRNLLESRRFFLTAQSRAPETNLFNLPRIAMWPVYRLDASSQIDLLRTNAFDRAIALCSSTKGEAGLDTATRFPHPYFFQREKALDPVNDLSAITRNRDLYSYLQYLTDAKIPGFGGSTFKSKYGSDRDQILTQMFDYIRCTNLYDDLLDFTTAGVPRSPIGQYTYTPSGVSNAHGIVVPIHGPNNTTGQGRYQTLRELNIHVIACAENTPTSTAQNSTSNAMLRTYAGRGSASSATVLPANSTRIQVMVIPDFYSTMVGWRLPVPDMRVEIENLNLLKINGVYANLPKLASFRLDSTGSPILMGNGSSPGWPTPYAWAVYKQKLSISGAPGADSSPPYQSGIYPFVGWPITVSNTNGMAIGEVPNVKVRLYVPGQDIPATTYSPAKPSVLVQQFELMIPATATTSPAPVPTVSTTLGNSFYSDVASNGNDGRLNVKAAQQITGSLLDYGTAGTTGVARDIVRSIVPSHGDYRLWAAMPEVKKGASDPTEVFVAHPYYNNTTGNTARVAAMWSNPDSTSVARKYVEPGYLVSGAGTPDLDLPPGTATLFPDNRQGVGVATKTGDFDRGVAHHGSGAGANKPDEGDFSRASTNASALQSGGATVPYYTAVPSQNPDSATYFSPNRMIPSPVMFGSLPTGVKSKTPWQTLLFRPPGAEETAHPGAVDPKDHLLLDLFWMPIVDPYAISDRFSTAGKINLNSQIIPFTYIERTAALRAALKSEAMARILTTNPSLEPTISNSAVPSVAPGTVARDPISGTEMMKQFKEQRYNDAGRIAAGKNVFISPSEICEMDMTPVGMKYGDMKDDWKNYRQTGDNLRERIYATVYPKLTTKSNTYTVHFRAQSLKRVPGSTPGTFTEGRDAMLGEYRGSTIIERYIDPAEIIPDYAADSTKRNDTLDHYYKWRMVQNTQFAP